MVATSSRSDRISQRKTPNIIDINIISRRNICTALLCPCCVNKSASNRNAFMDRLFAKTMATSMDEYEQAITPIKDKLFSQVAHELLAKNGDTECTIVDIGAGTGPNLKFVSKYFSDNNVKIKAIDPNEYMLPYLESTAESLHMKEIVQWMPGAAEAIALKSDSVDLVICTLVLCSVRDVEASLREIERVLKPGGKLLFIEHTLAREVLLQAIQYVSNPLQMVLADGCHLTRNPLPLIENAFASVDAMAFEVEGFSLIAPHVAGVASAAAAVLL